MRDIHIHVGDAGKPLPGSTRVDEVYRGYAIKGDSTRQPLYITKGGTNIGSAPNLAEAKKIIEMLT